VIDRNGPWVRVFANTDVQDKTDDSEQPELTDEDPVTPASGWIRDKGIVSPTTANGDAILFGAAANLEDEAAQPHAPKGAATQAHLLYRRAAEYFPSSPLAPEAAWRSADVRWQLEKRDVSTLPSAKEQEAYLRPQIYEGEMRKVMKQYPGTKYAALAAFDLIDNKLCGDWQGLPKCPEMESGLYEKYAKQFPDGPKSAEALYNATYRQGVLVSMYTVDDNQKRADAATERTKALADEMQAEYPKSDFTARAVSLAFRVQQGISIYGNDRD
jgi:outer membrane protein assembly factor BamD (BamD/ComL family)